MAETLDYFSPGVLTQDTKKRIETGEKLVAYLQDSKSSLYCEDMDKFVDGLSLWVNSSSFKVSLLGLDVLSLLITRMKASFKPYVTTVLSSVLDRLGDGKDQVRENAKKVLLSLMVPASTPQYVAERLTPGFTHKLWKVKEETLICLQCALNEWGAKNFGVSKLVPQIVKMLDDPSGPVRDQAMMTLVEFYRHIGEKVRTDLSKKDINASKLSMIFAKMDDAKNRGLVIATEKMEDECDRGSQPALPKKTSARSVSSGRTQATTIPKLNTGSDKGNLAAGAVDQDEFVRCFEDVPTIMVCSSKDILDRLAKVKDILSDTNKEWEKRCEALKEFRSCIIAGALNLPEFQQWLKTCSSCLCKSVQDLRSQIVKEACVTLAYLSQEMGRDFDSVAESLIPALVPLLANSAKIIASSGFVALQFIIQNTHSHRLLPLVMCNLTSKASVIRKQCCELLEQILRVWPVNVLEKQLAVLQDAIKRGLADPDNDARVASRRAYWNFEENFKQQASIIFSNLETSQQKNLLAVQGGSGSSSSSSTSSVNVHSGSVFTTRTQPISKFRQAKVRSVSGDRVKPVGNSRLPQSSVKHSQLPQRIPVGQDKSKEEEMPRSNSAANLSPSSKIARPANNNFNSLRHCQSSTDLSTPEKKPQQQPPGRSLKRNSSLRMPRSNTVRPGAVEARYKKSPQQSTVGGTATTSRSPKFGSSVSQPNSRSVSPASRFSYISQQPQLVSATTLATTNDTVRYGRTLLREPSPSRSETSDPNKRRKSAAPMRVPARESFASGVSRSVGGDGDHVTRNPMRRSAVPSQQWMSVVGSCIENIGAEEGGGSETSSLSSENSARSTNMEDISQVISGLTSGSWIDRKDSLLHLQSFFQNRKLLSCLELQRVKDSFARIFFDQNQKVFIIFLDTLVHFITAHKADLNPWVSVCLPQLLGKLGTESLASTQMKIQNVLDNIRVFFPEQLQFTVLTKFIVDQTQNANIGVKLAVLGYLHALTMNMTGDDIVNTNDVKLAITRIITWSTEPKSPEVRKVSSIVFIRLYQLNPAKFKSMLDNLPKAFQDSGNKILQDSSNTLDHNHDDTDSHCSDDALSSSSQSPSSAMFNTRRQKSPATSSKVPLRLNTSDSENINPFSNNNLNNFNNNISNINNIASSNINNNFTATRRSAGSPMVQLGNKPPGRTPVDTEHKFRSALPQSPFDEDDVLKNGLHDFTINKSALVVDRDIHSEGPELISDDHDDDDHGLTRPDTIDTIIQELAHRNESESVREIVDEYRKHFLHHSNQSRGEERKFKLFHLILIARNRECSNVWRHHSETILNLLLDSLLDDLDYIRELSLKAIVELMFCHLEHFEGRAETILTRVIEARRDTSSLVSTTAQDSALVIASLLPAHLCLTILHPFIIDNDFPTKLLSFKIQRCVVENITDKHVMRDLLPFIISGILKGYEDEMSPIRKESVFTLVTIYILIGDDLKPYLKDLSTSKMKLLNLYIKRALSHRDNPKTASSHKEGTV